MGSVALDADVVIGLLNPDDHHHAAATDALEERMGDTLLLSASTLAEVLVHATKANAADRVETNLERLGVEVVVVDREVARQAAALRAEHGRGLRLPDAFAWATALLHGATLLTFDDGLRALL